MIQLRQPRPPRQVRRDGEVGPAPERVLDEPGQVAPRPDLDEEPDAVGVHRLDRRAEGDRARPTARPRAAGSPRRRRPSGPRSRTSRSARSGVVMRQLAEERADRLERSRRTRGVIGPREGQLLAEHALGAEPSRPRPSPSSGSPATTTWCGQLSIAIVTARPDLAADRLDPRPVGGDRDAASPRGRGPSSRAARRPPELAEPVFEVRDRSEITPAAASARNSPLLWPTTASGRRPSRVEQLVRAPTAPRARR